MPTTRVCQCEREREITRDCVRLLDRRKRNREPKQMQNANMKTETATETDTDTEKNEDAAELMRR